MTSMEQCNAGRVPSQRILKHRHLSRHGIMHFSRSTFTEPEWGYGNDDPHVFISAQPNHEQLREVYSSYGSAVEVWFDGANNGEGYDEGACENRTIDSDYYQWDRTWRIVRELQPDACIFWSRGTDLLSKGNELGVANPVAQFVRFPPEEFSACRFIALSTLNGEQQFFFKAFGLQLVST